jgi:serine/threonine protein kinase
MNLCDKSLGALMKKLQSKPITPFWFWFYMERLSDGLLYLKRKGLIYRNLNPNNILINNGLLSKL